MKTVKTAGTSVEVYFEKYCFPKGEWKYKHLRDEYRSSSGIVGYRGYDPEHATFTNHMPAEEIRTIVGDDIWEGYFKFTVIRNPFDRLISAFYHFEKSRSAEKYIDSGKCDIELFRNWIASGGKQIDRSAYLIDGRICVDYFIKYESLHSDIEHVCDRLDIPFEPSELRKLKSEYRDNRFSIDEFYDEKTRLIVENMFSFELQEFGYKIPVDPVC